MNCRLGEQWDEQYETVTNGSEHEARNRHVAMNCRLGEQLDEQYETVTNGSEHEARNRHVAMKECECGQVTVEGSKRK